jgi:hypothetical protein
MSRDARLSDRIKQLSFDPSTGAFSLDSVATGFSPFSDFYEAGDVIFYAATDGTRYEVGSGEYTGSAVSRYPLRSNQISSGPYYVDAPSARESDAGVTGVWHPLYLTKSAASGLRGFDVAGGSVSPASGVHEHTFSGYPGVTFYMPNMEVAGHAQDNSVTKSGENYATSGSPVNFQGVTEVFVTYPGKYSVFSAGGISGFNEPKSKGVAFWGNEQTLDYDSNIVWDTGIDALGVSQPSPVHAIDVGGLTSYSQVRASGFIDGGSGVHFSGGQALPQSALKTASGGRQLEPFFRNEVDTQTKSDQVFSLSGLVDERILLQQQIKGAVFAGPASGCTATCSPDYPEFRYLELEDIPDLSNLYVVQNNATPYEFVPQGSIAFTTSSGTVEYSSGTLVFSKSNNRVSIGHETPAAALDVKGSILASGNIDASGDITANGSLRVGGNVVVSGNLDVQGGVTYIDSTQVMVVDKQLELGSMSGVAVYSDQVLDSGGLVLKSTTTTSGDKAFIFSEANGAWYSNQSILLDLGQKVKFNGGPDISGAYHAGSGLELHNGVAFNVGNLFQVSGNAELTSGVNVLGSIHQGDTLQVSGISGIHASFEKVSTGLDGDAGSGIVTIDPTHMYNALSGAIEQVDSVSNNWKIHVTSGTWHGYDYDDPTFPSGHVLETVGSALAVSGISGISLIYASGADDGPGFFISAAPISGYFESRIGGLGGGYGNWKINASGGNLEHGQVASGIVLDSITAGQAISFSGVEGLEVAYDATVNYMTFGAAPLSGLFTHVMGTEVLDSGATNMIINSGDRVLQIASGLSAVASGHAIDVSGYAEARIAGLGGGYGNWKVNASGGNLEHGEVASGILLDEITAGQAISFSGVEGVEVAYDATVNYMSFGAAPLSGYFDTLLGNEALVSGVTQLVINSGNSAIAVAAGSIVTYGSGLVRQNDVADLRHDGSGTLKHLIFSHGVRIGEGAGVGISGFDNLDAAGNGHPDSGIATAAVFIGSHAGSGSVNQFPTSGIFIGHEAGALSSGNQDSIFIGRSAGLSSDEFSTDASGQMHDNIGIGRNAARKLLNSDNSTFIGLNAGLDASGNQDAISIGKNSANELQSSQNSLFIGSNAGLQSTSINNSSFIGNSAGSAISRFDNSVMIGSNAGEGAVSSVGGSVSGTVSGVNNFIGKSAGSNSYACSDSTFIGESAGKTASGVEHSVAIGTQAFFGSISGLYNVGIGPHVGVDSSGFTSVVAIGQNAGLRSSGNTNCNFIGRSAGSQAGLLGEDGSGNMLNEDIDAFGNQAFAGASGCLRSQFIGRLAGTRAAQIEDSFIASFQAGYQADAVGDSVIIGNAAASNRSGIQDSVILGRQAGLGFAGRKHSDNHMDDSILIGAYAGYLSSGVDHVVAIGHQSLMNNGNNAGIADHKISDGIFIGRQAGYSSSAATQNRYPGDNNIIIANYSSHAADELRQWAGHGSDYIINIGHLMHGYSDGQTPARFLQVGDAPTSVSQLQESTLSVKPDSSATSALYLRRAAGQSADMFKTESSWNDQIVLTEQGVLQIPVATGLGSAGDYSTMRLTGSDTTVNNSPGSIVLFDDGSTELLLICGADGTWLKLPDELVPA